MAVELVDTQPALLKVMAWNERTLSCTDKPFHEDYGLMTGNHRE